jgi:hypothetical protein
MVKWTMGQWEGNWENDIFIKAFFQYSKPCDIFKFNLNPSKARPGVLIQEFSPLIPRLRRPREA